MTSRRPMTRSFSGNGRTSSFSEEEGSSSNGRSESRNTYLSSVRPENSYSRYSHYRPTRSTLCTVMAQLTEDIQPSFETTLKSKAVSENCNVKFSCVVTGYPAPELKWYKDDMEMDRYCGLPKYEIRRNGKTHTLHIYNCTLDDAAIYQVSASNSKGIVSCSGVLEVGTMNEYQIHQRFFAKLKEKAEKKRQDLEQQTKKDKDDKENIQEEKPSRSPERPPRKRPIPQPQPSPEVLGPEEPLGGAAESKRKSEAQETVPAPSVNTEMQKGSEQALAKKKIKISNGIDAECEQSGTLNSPSVRNHMMGIVGDNHYDGGMSLAQFLAETQKQASNKEEKAKIMESTKEKDNEEESKHKVEEEVKEQEKLQDRSGKEKSREDPSHPKRHEAKQHSKSQKEHKDHHIQASLSSMLHSVKDFFFGKNKKDSQEHPEHKQRDVSDLSSTAGQTPPSYYFKPETKAKPNNATPMEVEQLQEAKVESSQVVEQQEDVCKPESVVEVTEGGGADDPMEVTAGAAPGAPLSSLQLLTEMLGNKDQLLNVNQSDNSSDIPEHLTKEAESLPQTFEPPTVATPTEVDLVWPPPFSDTPIYNLSTSEDTTESSLGYEETSVHKPGSECQPQHTQAFLRLQKAQVKSHMSELASPLQGDERVSCESSQVLLVPDGQANSEQNVEQEAVCSSENQEMNVAQNTSENSDLLMHRERATSLEEESTRCFRAQSSQSGQDVEREEKHLAPLLSKEEASECPNAEVEEQNTQWQPATIKEPDEWKLSVSVKNLDENQIHVGHQEARETRLPIETVPEIQISTVEDTQDIKPIPQIHISFTEDIEDIESLQTENFNTGMVQDIKPLPQFQICTTEDIPEIKAAVPVICVEEDVPTPTIEISEPEVQECLSPFTNSICNQERKESNNESEVIIQNLNVSEPCMQNDLERAEDVTPADEPPMFEQPSQSDYSIPIINVSCTEEVNGELFNWNLSAQTVTLPLFEIPPVTGTFHQSELESRIASTPSEQRETTVASILSDQKETTVASTPSEQRETTVASTSSDQRPTTVASAPSDQRETTIVSTLSDQRETTIVSTLSNQRETTIVSTLSDQRETTIVSTLSNQRETTIVSTLSDQRETTIVSTLSDPRETTVASTPSEQRETTIVSTLNDQRETEATQTQQSADKQNQDELVEQNTLENKPPVECEAPKTDVNVLALSKTVEDSIESEITKSLKEARIESFMSVERLSFKPPLYPSLSPSSLRKFMSKASTDSDATGDRQSDKAEDDLSGGSTPTSSLSCESSPRLKRRDSLSLIRSATPEELASGARRKIFIPKTKEDSEDSSNKKESPYMSPGQARRTAFLQAPSGQNTPPMERRSPLLNRRKATLEVPKVVEEIPAPEPLSTKREEKPGDKKPDPLKAPQVIRKIRGEPFPDASGHLKLWCQFFNVLSDSTIKWYKDEEEILEVQRSGGDESQVALAIVLASIPDCGVYGCTIKNEYGTDTTDFLLSEDVMSEILLKDDLEVGEEIEMTPLLFNRGLADSGSWGGKFFGRIMTQTVHLGEGWAHKTSRAKVIYGLDPIFESGSSCIMKIQNPIAYGTKLESNLAERNQEITKQECRVQNMIREYCKIFTAEARVNENFGSVPEVISQYLMYRPANSVPYATVEADLQGLFQTYCCVDPKGKMMTNSVSEVEQKCCTFQHWIHEWTHGNLLVTRLEGVDFKLTNIRVATKSKGYQGLSESSSPEVFDQFITHHQCNYYCGLLGLRPLKSMDSKMKGSRSPLLNRKLSIGSGSPHVQKKGSVSPQSQRKAATSPKVPRKSQETEDSNGSGKDRAAESTAESR